MDRRTLPSVDRLLRDPAIAALSKLAPRNVIVAAVRDAIADARRGRSPAPEDWSSEVADRVSRRLTPSLQPVLNAEGHLQPAPWIQSWELLTEPFVAIVDADGKVRAKFEGVVARDELDAAIGEL